MDIGICKGCGKKTSANNSNGSITIETAIVFPIIMAILLFGY